MFVNDLFRRGGPARGDKSLWMPDRIGNRVSIGSNATILPVTICDDVVVGAGAVVTRDIVEPRNIRRQSRTPHLKPRQ